MQLFLVVFCNKGCVCFGFFTVDLNTLFPWAESDFMSHWWGFIKLVYLMQGTCEPVVQFCHDISGERECLPVTYAVSVSTAWMWLHWLGDTEEHIFNFKRCLKHKATAISDHSNKQTVRPQIRDLKNDMSNFRAESLNYGHWCLESANVHWSDFPRGGIVYK